VAHLKALLSEELNGGYIVSCRKTVEQEAAIGFDARLRSTARNYPLRDAIDAPVRKHRVFPGQEISQQVAAIQDATKNLVDAIAEIARAIEQLTAVAAGIASAVEEQSTTASDIAGSIQTAADHTASASTEITSVEQAAGRTATAFGEVTELIVVSGGRS